MRKLVGAAIAVTVAVYALILWYEGSLRETDPVGFRNLKACTKLKPGIGEADLVRAFGPPERSEEGAGVRRLAFHTHAEAAAPIRAEVEVGTGRVLELRCREDERPTWALRR